AKLAAVVESSEDAVIGTTLDGTITTWNEAARRIFGYAAEEVVGKPVALLVPPDRRDEEPRILERLRRGEGVESFETVRVTKGGRRVDVSVTVSPSKDPRGRIIGGSKV